MIYPPYCDICVVSAQSLSRDSAAAAVNSVFENIKSALDREYSSVKLIILGPSAAAVPKVNNRYRFRMIIKCRNGAEFRSLLRKAIDIKCSADTQLSVDMNPETII